MALLTACITKGSQFGTLAPELHQLGGAQTFHHPWGFPHGLQETMDSPVQTWGKTGKRWGNKQKWGNPIREIIEFLFL